MKMGLRTKLFLWLKKRVFKVPEGVKMEGVALAVLTLLYPIDRLRWHFEKTAKVKQDFYTGNIMIHGYCMTTEYFWDVLVPQFEEAGIVPE